uniref:Uncharacterized protein n=1 Tax=Aegilops tauschii subsp. strangulata TaxID=200361 RepID=A0A453N7G4_AEGTS
MAPATSPRHLLLLLFLWLCAAASTAWAHGGGGDADSGDADGGGEAKPDLRARGLVATKLWCLALVFAGTLAGGVSPYFMRWNEAFLALGTQFAGGVFLSTAMMHFLSDANETFGDLLPHSEYPFAFMLACAGYVLTMLAECAISSVVARGRTAPAAAAAPARELEEGKLSSTNGNGAGRARAVGDGPLDGVDAAERQHPRRQHTAHRSALLPLRLRGHRHRSRRDEGGRVEGAVDDQPAQGVRGGGHGHRAAPDAAQPAAALLLRLRLRLRRLQPHRRRRRHRHRRHHAGRRGRLDLRRLHGPRHRHLHLRLRQPPPLQGVQAPAARRRRHAPRPLARRRARRRGHRRRHDMGH